MESLVSVGSKLEVAIYVGVVVMHVISFLLHCGGLTDDGKLHDLPVMSHLSVSTIIFAHLYTYICTCIKAVPI